jgi:hypothetical protein
MTDATPFAARRAAFRALHQDGFFVLPNPWDAGGAVRLQKLGFKALASTSAGMAWSWGRADGEVGADEVIEHLRLLVAASDLPVNADFEAGFASDVEGVAANVARAVETGVAGLSIEDRVGADLYDIDTAVARIAAARSAIDASGQDVMLVGRTEGFLIGRDDLAPTIERLQAYSEAGADCLYAPGVTNYDDIAAIVAAAAPKPVNVLLWGGDMKLADLPGLGVRRASTGAALAAAAWAGFEAAAKDLLV